MKLRTEIDFDPVTPFLHVPGDPKECCIDDVCKDAMAAHAYKQAVKQVLGYYPESAFPEDGESLDCKSASMARHTCNNIEKRAAEILAGWLGEDRG